MNIQEAVNGAINFERKGVSFYMELAAQTENRLGRRLFYTLAKEEVEHILIIDDIRRRLDRGEKADKELDLKTTIEEQMKEYFGAFKPEQMQEKSMSNLDGYEMAMEIENRGYEMYDRFLQEATEERAQEFFKKMKEEEKRHFEALQNVYYYLTNRDHWHSESESTVWNWMV